MTLTRRRVLLIAAGFVASPAWAAVPTVWRGRALGAEVSIEVAAPETQARPAITEAVRAIRRVEALFSLHDPNAALARLNATGSLASPPPDMLALFAAADEAYRATGGLFDPTIQPLWRALAEGRDPAPARALTGWHRVAFDPTGITLGKGQALSFNGIAQGHATDLVTGILRRHGLSDLFVDIGEQAALGRPRRLGLHDPAFGVVGQVTLENRAVATSSPAATPLGTSGHILGPRGENPRWSTVSVVADTATRADALSTAGCLADAAQLARMAALPGVHRIVALDRAGNLRSF